MGTCAIQNTCSTLPHMGRPAARERTGARVATEVTRWRSETATGMARNETYVWVVCVCGDGRGRREARGHSRRLAVSRSHKAARSFHRVSRCGRRPASGVQAAGRACGRSRSAITSASAPRAIEQTSFEQLRNLAALYDGIQLCVHALQRVCEVAFPSYGHKTCAQMLDGRKDGARAVATFVDIACNDGAVKEPQADTSNVARRVHVLCAPIKVRAPTVADQRGAERVHERFT